MWRRRDLARRTLKPYKPFISPLLIVNCQLLIILVIRVLCIGNSFSWDAVEQELVPLCEEKGIEIEVHNLYYGGCSLQQHVVFMQKNKPVYGHRICTNNTIDSIVNQSSNRQSSDRQFRVIKDTISLRQALMDGRYDYI